MDTYDALSISDLRARDAKKWHQYPGDVLPLWVADMDFPIAQEIKEALASFALGNDYGYQLSAGRRELKPSLVKWLADNHNWQVEEDHIEAINGIVPGLYLASLSCTTPSEEVLIPTPIYPPFMKAAQNTHRHIHYVQMVEKERWELDLDALEDAVTDSTRLLMFCNPQNPTGRVFSREELESLAAFVLKHDLWIVSDELHADITYDHQHIPIASLGSDIAQRTLTLYGPTKPFNIAGLKVGFAISENPELLTRFKEKAEGLVGPPNTFGQVATIAAYTQGDKWLRDTLSYIKANRDFVAEYLAAELPQIGFKPPEGTYLAWLDFRNRGIEDLESFLLEQAKVGLNQGPSYGPGGEGFARLNLATSRAIVTEALERIRKAL